jgi:hypothetical protein
MRTLAWASDALHHLRTLLESLDNFFSFPQFGLKHKKDNNHGILLST